jgi:micrococcal nuclease
MYEYAAKVKRVLDGDTIDVVIDLGFDVDIKQTLRMNRINAYETTLRNGTTPEQKALGIEGKKFLTELLPVDSVIIVNTEKSDKYDRYLAEVTFNGVNLNNLMVSKGYAVYQTYL